MLQGLKKLTTKSIKLIDKQKKSFAVLSKEQPELGKSQGNLTE